MGLISGIIGANAIDKIIKGEKCNLSLSQIVENIVNLPDASRNLTKEQFNEVFKIYQDYHRHKEKIYMDAYAYYLSCKAIITTFDKIAPFEKYSGKYSNDWETFLDNEIRKYRPKC